MPPPLRSFIGCFSTKCLEDVGRQETRGTQETRLGPSNDRQKGFTYREAPAPTKGNTGCVDTSQLQRAGVSSQRMLREEGLGQTTDALFTLTMGSKPTRFDHPGTRAWILGGLIPALLPCSSFWTSLVSVSPSVKWVLLYLPLGYYDIWIIGYIITIT